MDLYTVKNIVIAACAAWHFYYLFLKTNYQMKTDYDRR